MKTVFSLYVHARGFVLLLCAFSAPAVLAVMAGCSGEVETGLPRPGEMKVISVTPVEVTVSSSLIPEAAFETWWAGAPKPGSETVIMPAQNSTISRKGGKVAAGNMALQQVWLKKDSPFHPENLFGIQLKDLKPRTQYRLTGAALAAGDSSATIEVYGVTGAKDPLWQMSVDWLHIKGAEDWQTFEGTFAVGDITTVRITTAYYGDIKKDSPNEVAWDNWQLTEAGPAEWPDVHPTQDNLIANGSFEVWVPGEETPRGTFIAPNSSLKHSRVRPMLIAHTDGDAALLQEWHASDREDAPSTLFGVQLFPDKNTTYRFSMFTHMMERASLSIHVYGINASEEFIPIADPLIETEAGQGWKRYEAEFNTGENAKIRIVVRGPQDEAAYPDSALFDAWSLVRIGG